MKPISEFTDKIICGDYLDVLKEIPTASIDLIVTDPPYDFEVFGGGFYGKEWNGKQNNQREYLIELNNTNCTAFNPQDFLKEAKRIMKVFNMAVFCNKLLIPDYLNFAKDNNFLFDIHVIAKTNPIPAKNNHFLNDLEYIVLIREKGSYFCQDEHFHLYRKFFTVSCTNNKFHPAEKPLELIKKYIAILSKDGDIVLDPFIGGGTTAIACKELNRSFIGIDSNPKWIEVANNRINKLTETPKIKVISNTENA